MKKFLCLLLVTMFAVSFMTISVNADGITFYLEADKKEAKPGDTLALTVKVSENSEVMSTGLIEVVYDNEMVKYLGTYVAGNTGLTSAVTDSIPKATFIGTSGITGNTFITFNFEVLEGATGVAGFSLDMPDGITIVSNPFSKFFNYSVEGVNVNISSFSTKTTVEVGNEMVFKTVVTDCPDNGVVYAACYNGTTLVGCDYKVFTSAITEPVTFTMPVPTAYTGGKIFIWDADGKPLLETPEDVEI